jgi:hypothetical protein
MARRRNPITDKDDRMVADTIKKTLVDKGFAKSSNIRIFQMNRPESGFGVYISDRSLEGYIKIISDSDVDEVWGPITDYLIAYKFVFKYDNGSTKVVSKLSPSFFASDHIKRETGVTLKTEIVMRTSKLVDELKTYHPDHTTRRLAQPILHANNLTPLYDLTARLQDEGFDRKDMMIYKELMLFTLNDEELEVVASLEDGRLLGYFRYSGRGDRFPERFNVSSVDQLIKKLDEYIMKRNNPSQSDIDERIRKLDQDRSSIVWSLSHGMGRPDPRLLSELDKIDAEIRELKKAKKNFNRRSNPVGSGTLLALGIGYFLGKS